MIAFPEEKPPRVKARLAKAPRVRNFYWCAFPRDAQLPEFWKQRPVIVLAATGGLTGSATVVPCSSQSQIGNEWAVKLKETIDGHESWAICDKPTTVAVSRLTSKKQGQQRLPQDEFEAVLSLVLRHLPKLPSAD